MATHVGKMLVSVAGGAEGVVENGLIFGENDVAKPIGVGLDEEKAQHEVGAKIDEDDSAGESEDVLKETSLEEEHARVGRGFP